MALTLRQTDGLIVFMGVVLLAACNRSPAPEAQPNQDSAVSAPAAGTVTRETPPAETAPAALPSQAAIQSQPASDGAQVDLLKVAVTGDILTVTMRCSSDKKYNTRSFALKDISVIDDATAQRIAVLKDNQGNWLASKVSGDTMFGDCTLQPGILWAKFAAPSAGAKTVSINLPEVAPFDGVPVTH